MDNGKGFKGGATSGGMDWNVVSLSYVTSEAPSIEVIKMTKLLER
jgi:hypothetical protein